MVIRVAARLMLALLLWGLPLVAQATGPNLPEVRFFSRSGQDPESDIPFFHGRLGILRPSMDDNRLYAAYRLMIGGSFTDAQAQQLLARCCGTADVEYAANSHISCWRRWWSASESPGVSAAAQSIMSPGIMAMPPVPLCSMMPKIVSAVPVKSGFHRGRTTMTATRLKS